MKRFFCTAIAFVLVVLLLFTCVLWASTIPVLNKPIAQLTCSTEYTAEPNDEVTNALRVVQSKPAATKLILGDSVCAQIFQAFEPCNEDYAIAGCNSGLTLAGQYLLAKEFLTLHPDAEEIFLVLTPESFSATYDAALGYSYAVEPFVKVNLLKNLDEYSYNAAKKAYGFIGLNQIFADWFETSSLVRKLFLNGIASFGITPEKGVFSPLAQDNLLLLQQLCDENGVTLHLVCAPISDTPERHQAMEALEQEFRRTGFYEQYSSYFTDIFWYDSALTQDGIHFAFNLATVEFDGEQVRHLQAATGLFEGIVLSLNE